MRQCLSDVYGFVTTGDYWQMPKYDGIRFQMTRNMTALFEGMKALWMKDCSVVVDCIVTALRSGGIVEQRPNGSEMGVPQVRVTRGKQGRSPCRPKVPQ